MAHVIKKRILLIDQYNAIGGGQNILIRVAKILVPYYQVTFWGPLNGDLCNRLKKIRQISFVKGIAWDKSIHKREYFLNYTRTVINTIKVLFFFYRKKELRPDLIFANGGKIYPQAIVLSFFLNKPLVLAMHLLYNNLMQKFLLFVIQRLKKIYLLFVSYSVAERFNKVNNIKLEDSIYEKIFIHENSLSEEESKIPFDSERYERYWKKNGKKDFEKNKVKNQKLHLAIVGRIHPEKGQDHLFDIIDEANYKNWKFSIIGSYSFGEGKYFTMLKERLADKVNFFGEATDVPRAIRTLGIHLVIMPSRVAESFGLIAVEAMASSCFTIVSDQGELRNIAKKTGAFVFRDSKILVELLKEVAEMSKKDFVKKVNKMYCLTQKLFPFNKYKKNLLNIFDTIFRKENLWP